MTADFAPDRHAPVTHLGGALNASALSWPVVAITAVFSIVIHLAASTDLRPENLVVRTVAAVLSIVPIFACVALAKFVTARRRRPSLVPFAVAYLMGGALRGWLLAGLLDLFGVVEGGGWSYRIPSGALSMTATLMVATYAVSTFRANKQTLRALILESQRLTAALSEIEQQARSRGTQHVTVLARYIVNELERIQQSPVPEQITAIQRIVDSTVRPLSVAFAAHIRPWQPPVLTQADGRHHRVIAEFNPAARTPSVWYLVALSFAPLPTAWSTFGATQAFELVLFTGMALIPTGLMGYALARKVTPRLNTYLRFAVFLSIMLVIAAAGAAATVVALWDTSNPTAYVVPAMIAFPMYALILAAGGDYLEKFTVQQSQLSRINADLQWAIARVNLVMWFNQGEASRLLHGPIQNVLHATLIRLRGAAPERIIETVIVRLTEEFNGGEKGEIDSGDRAALAINGIDDIAALWSSIATVNVAIEHREALLDDVALATILNELCHESCSNAIRHGGATRLDLAVSFNGHLAVVRLTDNGTAHTTESGGGIGTRLIEACSVECDQSRTDDINMLVVALPYLNDPTATRGKDSVSTGVA